MLEWTIILTKKTNKHGVPTKTCTPFNLLTRKDLRKTLRLETSCLFHLQGNNFNPLASRSTPSKFSNDSTGRVTHHFEAFFVLYSNAQVLVGTPGLYNRKKYSTRHLLL